MLSSSFSISSALWSSSSSEPGSCGGPSGGKPKHCGPPAIFFRSLFTVCFMEPPCVPVQLLDGSFRRNPLGFSGLNLVDQFYVLRLRQHFAAMRFVRGDAQEFSGHTLELPGKVAYV